MKESVSVLVVCTGNICRSPTGEGVLRHLAGKRGIADRVRIRSAGTHDYHVGECPDARTLKHAKLLRVEGIDASYEQFKKDGLEVLAGLKPRLVSDAEKLPGSRVLDGQVTGVQQAVGTTRSRASGAKYLSEFVEDIKKTGLVAKTIEKHGVKGVTVAP
jgi:hypothetical protein